ncbi:MAG: amidohydrolase family protein [Oscillospiraceae bacterium]|nr:amidohydrolase family protein [Oscillospiraceae bacterium]
MWDILIRGGTVYDGWEKDGFAADVAVSEGVIAAIGPHLNGDAAREIDARGMAVTPGFIDVHRHGDLAALRPGFGEIELRQGLTTVINGNCGMSAAPARPGRRREILDYLAPILGRGEAPTPTMAAYRAALPPLPLNVGTLVGGGVLRADAAGFASGPLSDGQYRHIHRQMEAALSEGALGVSLGLGYAPECYYTTDELIRALAPLRGTDIPLTVHTRDEGTNVDKSVAEMLAVARALRCPLHISHLKAIGRANWGKKIPAVLSMLENARRQGLDVTWDVYPYTAGSTQLLHVLPPEVLQGGAEAICRRLADPACRDHVKQRLQTAEDYNNIVALMGWENIYLTSLRLPENQPLIGKSVAEIAAIQGKPEADCAFDLLIAEGGDIAMVDFIAAEEDIAAILRSSAVSLISDSTYPTAGRPHPRLYGTFVRAIEKYAVQDRVLTLPQAIHRMTAAPAAALHLQGRGELRPGFAADINIFDPLRLHETGTYAHPAQFPTGMDTVMVNGAIVLRRGALTDAKPGNIL